MCHESEAGNPDRGSCDHESDLLFSDEIRQTVRQTKKTAGSGKRFVPFGRSFRRTRRRAGDEHLSPQDKPLEFQDILSADADRSGCSSRIYHREVDCLRTHMMPGSKQEKPPRPIRRGGIHCQTGLRLSDFGLGEIRRAGEKASSCLGCRRPALGRLPRLNGRKTDEKDGDCKREAVTV